MSLAGAVGGESTETDENLAWREVNTLWAEMAILNARANRRTGEDRHRVMDQYARLQVKYNNLVSKYGFDCD